MLKYSKFRSFEIFSLCKLGVKFCNNKIDGTLYIIFRSTSAIAYGWSTPAE